MRYPVVEKERLKRGLTVAELADKLGICRKTYYNWQNRGGMPQRAVVKLSALFGISSDAVLSHVMLPNSNYRETERGARYDYQRISQ